MAALRVCLLLSILAIACGAPPAEVDACVSAFGDECDETAAIQLREIGQHSHEQSGTQISDGGDEGAQISDDGDEGVREAADSEGLRQGDPSAVVAEHNKFRKQHGAPPLTWDNSLASKALACAQSNNKNGGLSHSAPGCQGSWGQNLAMGNIGPAAVDMWYNEIKNTPGGKGVVTTFGMNTGHYTQVVWKGTKKVGCGAAGNYFCCNYSPAGNMMGAFQQNVQGKR